MRTVYGLAPQPFRPLRSFLAYACGDERIEVKPEWRDSIAALPLTQGQINDKRSDRP